MPDVLDASVLDRASGVLIAQAAGDALGVPYEFATPPRYGEDAVMRGGGLGPYEPGEWSDDTQMAVCVARVTATSDLDPASQEGPRALDDVAAAFENWKLDGASDIGRQTAAVLRNASRLVGSPSARLRQASRAMHQMPGLTAGNGVLMRAGILGLVALDDRAATARTARAVSELTHADPIACDSCVLWSEAVRLAVTEGRLDVAAGLDLLPEERRLDWAGWIADAEAVRPSSGMRANGFSVTALQAAWHAITMTTPTETGPVNDRPHLTSALQAVIRIGGDTDTTAAIAGALLGARYGTSAVPVDWQRPLHGWPGLRARELGALARATVQRTYLAGPPGDESFQTCPLCSTAILSDPRYPDKVCAWCKAWVTDESGRPVRLYNVSLSGGFTAQYDDGSPASSAVLTGRTWIDGREFRAGEAHQGGTVVRPPS